jgi:LCP family protein required for cell wall assembly
LIAAGRRGAGGLVLGILAFFGAIAALIFLFTPTARLASYGGDRQMLLYIGYGLVALAALWVLIALVSHRSLEPHNLPGGKRFIGSLMVILAASVVVAPMAVAARNAFTQRELIGAISADYETSQTVPEIENVKDPWENIPRLNILLLGGDTGGARDENKLGIRPDTQIVASIDTDTGETTLISLPRNLENVPFPEESGLASYYPYGFSGAGDEAEWFLNAVYKNVPLLHSDVSASDANKWAVEGALGIEVDYFMMVDLDGFSAIVDALGGVKINVDERVPINYGEPDASCYNRAEWIEAGQQELDGNDALAYARSRCGGDNYKRMDLQQQVLQAIISSAKPEKLLTEYQSLAGAAQQMVKTDIDPDLFPAIIELTVKVQSSPVESLNLDTDFFAEHGGSAGSPDYPAIHAAIEEALQPADSATGDPTDDPSSSPTESDEADDDTGDTGDTGDTSTSGEDTDEGDGGGEWSGG